MRLAFGLKWQGAQIADAKKGKTVPGDQGLLSVGRMIYFVRHKQSTANAGGAQAAWRRRV